MHHSISTATVCIYVLCRCYGWQCNDQPATLLPSSTQQQQQHVQSHISTGNVQQGGNGVSKAQHVQLESTSASQHQQLPTQATKDFFSQLDWQSGDTGYTAFADESESDSDESSSSSDDEDEMFNRTNIIQSNTRATQNHVVSILLHTCTYTIWW